jgi:hypothetical protein
MASRRGPQPLADDGRDRRVPIDLPQLDLPAGDQAEEPDQAAASVGSEPCVFTRQRNSSLSRSITFVVRSVFHCAFGKVKKVSSSAPPSMQ